MPPYEIITQAFVSSPAWLIYNIISLSIGAICCEVFSLISILVGLLRLDREKNEK